MRWMQGNSIDVTSKILTDTSRATTASKNTTRVTGSDDSNDILNNIYDILGNSYEWTQEAFSVNKRVFRGGNYNSSSSPKYRNVYYSTHTGGYCGSRLSLYVGL